MKVFISWPGPTSQRYAEILRDWLPSVLQATEPYYSAEDIEKGTRWSAAIARELAESGTGIICLTRDNLTAPWIMFEAGALAKHLDNSRVCPILFDLEKSDVVGPLAQFQLATFDRDDIERVLRTVNDALKDRALKPQVLEQVFAKWWPDLETRVQEASKAARQDGAPGAKPQRDTRDILEEILQLARSLAKNTAVARSRYADAQARDADAQIRDANPQMRDAIDKVLARHARLSSLWDYDPGFVTLERKLLILLREGLAATAPEPYLVDYDELRRLASELGISERMLRIFLHEAEDVGRIKVDGGVSTPEGTAIPITAVLLDPEAETGSGT